MAAAGIRFSNRQDHSLLSPAGGNGVIIRCMNRLLLASVFGALLLVCLAGSAQTSAVRDMNWAFCQDNNPDQAISGCTAIIDSKAEKDATRLTALHNRGKAYLGKGEYDKAIADCDAALHLKPDSFLDLEVRGNAYLDKGEFEKAIADFDSVLRIKPDFARAFNRRAYAELFAGRFAPAATDLEKGTASMVSAYNVLWLHMARARSGQDDAQELARNAAKVDLKVWPGPLVAMFLKQASPEQVMAAANSDPNTARDAVCVADFFLGEKALIESKPQDAERLFVQTRNTCPPAFLQYKGAQAELKLMGK